MATAAGRSAALRPWGERARVQVKLACGGADTRSVDLDLEPDPMLEAEYRAEELAQELADVLRLPVEVAIVLDEGGKHECHVRMRAAPSTEPPPELHAVPDATS